MKQGFCLIYIIIYNYIYNIVGKEFQGMAVLNTCAKILVVEL